jgi:hypothetical protein
MPALTSWHFLYYKSINYLAGVVAAGASCVGAAALIIINESVSICSSKA